MSQVPSDIYVHEKCVYKYLNLKFNSILYINTKYLFYTVLIVTTIHIEGMRPLFSLALYQELFSISENHLTEGNTTHHS